MELTRLELEEYQELLVAPLGLREGIVRLIEEQTEKVQMCESARITCKMSALTDPRIIESLYEVSQAGVRIDLIIRAICCLRPGLRWDQREHPGGLAGESLPGTRPRVCLLGG